MVGQQAASSRVPGPLAESRRDQGKGRIERTVPGCKAPKIRKQEACQSTATADLVLQRYPRFAFRVPRSGYILVFCDFA
jgi:hypothetical protein